MELVNPFNDQYFALFGYSEHIENEIISKSPAHKDKVLNVGYSLPLVQRQNYDAPKYSKIDKTVNLKSSLQSLLKNKSQNKTTYQQVNERINIDNNIIQSEKNIKNLSQIDDTYLIGKQFDQSTAPLNTNKNNKSGFLSYPHYYGFDDHIQKNSLPELFAFRDTKEKQESEFYKKIFREKVEPLFHGSVSMQRGSNCPFNGRFTKIKPPQDPGLFMNSSSLQEENIHIPISTNDRVTADEEYHSNFGMLRYPLFEQNEVSSGLLQNELNHCFATQSYPLVNKQNHFSANKSINTPKNSFPYRNTLINSPNEFSERFHSSNDFYRVYNPHSDFYNSPSIVNHFPFMPNDVSSYMNTSMYPSDVGMQLINGLSHNIYQDNRETQHKTQNILINQNGFNENHYSFADASYFFKNPITYHLSSNQSSTYHPSSIHSYENEIASAFNVKSTISCGDIESSYFQHFFETENFPIACTDQQISSNTLSEKKSASIIELMEKKQKCISEYKKQANQQNTNAEPRLYNQLDKRGKQRVNIITEKCEKRSSSKSINLPSCKLKETSDQVCFNSTSKLSSKCFISDASNNNVLNCTHKKRKKMSIADSSTKRKRVNEKENIYDECLEGITNDNSLDSQKQNKKSDYSNKNCLLPQASQCDKNACNKMTSDLLFSSNSLLSPVLLRPLDASPSKILSKLPKVSSKDCQEKIRKVSRSVKSSSEQKVQISDETVNEQQGCHGKKIYEQQDCHEKVRFYSSTLKKELQQECLKNFFIYDIIRAQLDLCVKLNLSIKIKKTNFHRSQHKQRKLPSFNRMFIAIFLNSYKKIHKTHKRKQLNPIKRTTQQ